MTDPQKQLTRDYASAAEAMEILGVRQQTLYAYVSRGWIHSIAQKGLKDKLYLRDDLARVGSRSLARAGHSNGATKTRSGSRSTTWTWA